MSEPTGGAEPRQTPLHDAHRRAGGKIVPFAGWSMPVRYAGILEEHRTVRTAVGLFDVSHMGEVEILGPAALETCQRIFTNDVAKLRPGRALYTVACLPDGGIVDDLVVYQLAPERYFVCVNAGNRDKDFAWIAEHAGAAEVRNRSDDFAQLALQGPRAAEVLGPICSLDLAAMKRFGCGEGEVLGVPAIVSRTGYTGEDGFEIYLAPDRAEAVWDGLLEAGRGAGIQPIGLGARDTLRLEAGLLLYGSDIDETTSPIEAGLGWVVKLDKGEFLGREALATQVAEGVERRLAGLVTSDGSIPRHGYPVFRENGEVGTVSSGTKSPSDGRGIALAWLRTEHAKPGTRLEVEIRAKRHEAHVVRPSFLER